MGIDCRSCRARYRWNAGGAFPAGRNPRPCYRAEGCPCCGSHPLPATGLRVTASSRRRPAPPGRRCGCPASYSSCANTPERQPSTETPHKAYSPPEGVGLARYAAAASAALIATSDGADRRRCASPTAGERRPRKVIARTPRRNGGRKCPILTRHPQEHDVPTFQPGQPTPDDPRKEAPMKDPPLHEEHDIERAPRTADKPESSTTRIARQANGGGDQEVLISMPAPC